MLTEMFSDNRPAAASYTTRKKKAPAAAGALSNINVLILYLLFFNPG